MAYRAGVADIKCGMAIHTFTHQHFALNFFRIDRVGLVAVATRAVGFQAAVFELGSHDDLVAEIDEVGLLRI